MIGRCFQCIRAYGHHHPGDIIIVVSARVDDDVEEEEEDEEEEWNVRVFGLEKTPLHRYGKELLSDRYAELSHEESTAIKLAL